MRRGGAGREINVKQLTPPESSHLPVLAAARPAHFLRGTPSPRLSMRPAVRIAVRELDTAGVKCAAMQC
jgi:hypothetical protein